MNRPIWLHWCLNKKWKFTHDGPWPITNVSITWTTYHKVVGHHQVQVHHHHHCCLGQQSKKNFSPCFDSPPAIRMIQMTINGTKKSLIQSSNLSKTFKIFLWFIFFVSVDTERKKEARWSYKWFMSTCQKLLHS